MKGKGKDQGFRAALFEVRGRPWDRQGERLEIFYDGEHIGEYERTHYSKRDPRLQDKIREAHRAAPLLVAHARAQKNGKVAVRFTEGTRRKEIRAYDDNNTSDPGRGQEVLARIPREIWRRERRA